MSMYGVSCSGVGLGERNILVSPRALLLPFASCVFLRSYLYPSVSSNDAKIYWPVAAGPDDVNGLFSWEETPSKLSVG